MVSQVGSDPAAAEYISVITDALNFLKYRAGL